MGGPGKDIQRVITSHADAAKIGRKIVDEVQAASPQAAGQPVEKPLTPPKDTLGEIQQWLSIMLARTYINFGILTRTPFFFA